MAVSRTVAAALILVSTAWAARSLSGCVGDSPVTTPPVPPSPSEAGAPASPDSADGKKSGGQACASAGECSSGHCADAVCCDSDCKGTCEACNLPGSSGRCEPIPDGQDPKNQCPTPPLPDAGAPLDASAGDGGDAGAVVNIPDGGVKGDDAPCSGKCNGKRACAFPSSEKTCGTVFCNTRVDQGRASCDGQGHCVLGLEACQAYVCPEGASGCGKACTSPADCLDTHYCDTGGTCKRKLGNGTICMANPQCQSGFCVGGVCCNDSCTGIGGNCSVPGKVGTCTCPACATGACTLWYRDQDSDGFGDVSATNGAGAAPGCVSGPAPVVGYVKDHTDCDDNNNRVKPGQTAYFTQPRANNSFDYDCDGKLDKETPEFVGGSCRFCSGSLLTVCTSQSTCSSAGRQAHHSCGSSSSFCGVPPRICLGCIGKDPSAFHSTVSCGNTGTLFTCGTCAASGGGASASTTLKAQGCR